MQHTKLLNLVIRKAIIALMVIVVTVIGVVILSNNITKIRTSLTETKRSALYFENRTDEVKLLHDQFARVGEADAKIVNAYIPDDNIVDFISLLSTLASQNSVQLTPQFNPVATQVTLTNGMMLSSIDFSASVTGNINAFVNFVKHYETLPHFAELHAIRISATSPKGIDESAAITIQGRIYAHGKAQ